ncbi:MAG: outer membrane lipoprotein-sorting protein [Gammaproteobacteria bacterium]
MRTSRRDTALCRIMCPVLLLFMPAELPAQVDTDALSGRELMEEVYQRHRQFPYVYEEQSMILIDRNGNRETRRARRYSRVEQDGTAKFLLLFDSPREVRGVALLAVRNPDGETRKSVYLPAYGSSLIESSGKGGSDNFLGTDFSVENIVGEELSDYRYVRRRNENIDDALYYVVDAYRPDEDPETHHPARRHYVLQDNFYIARTDYFDTSGRLRKRRTHHDIRAVDGRMWRSGMVLMDDKREQHRTLIKIHRRVFSRDYVPEEMFTKEWLFKNHPHLASRDSEEDTEELMQSPEGTGTDGGNGT